MKGSVFSAPRLGLMQARPMTDLHILHICMFLMTQSKTYMTQNDAVLIHGMIMTMNMSFFLFLVYSVFKNHCEHAILSFFCSLCVLCVPHSTSGPITSFMA